ncbi:MAG: hypothetical protein WC511_02315 [Candidatus Pacearchaeota archaeon]
MTKHCKKWTERDISFLKKNYTTMTLPLLSTNLRRTVAAVRKKMEHLWLSTRDCVPSKTDFKDVGSVDFHEIPLKFCPKCEDTKALTSANFFRRSASSDGFMNVCKKCYSTKYFPKKEKKVVIQRVVKSDSSRNIPRLKTLPPETIAQPQIAATRLRPSEIFKDFSVVLCDFLEKHNIKANVKKALQLMRETSEKIADL